jgi:hypothetical protein
MKECLDIGMTIVDRDFVLNESDALLILSRLRILYLLYRSGSNSIRGSLDIVSPFLGGRMFPPIYLVLFNREISQGYNAGYRLYLC